MNLRVTSPGRQQVAMGESRLNSKCLRQGNIVRCMIKYNPWNTIDSSICIAKVVVNPHVASPVGQLAATHEAVD